MNENCIHGLYSTGIGRVWDLDSHIYPVRSHPLQTLIACVILQFPCAAARQINVDLHFRYVELSHHQDLQVIGCKEQVIQIKINGN